MTFFVPGALFTYIDFESNNLKVPRTALPVALSAGANDISIRAADRGALPDPLPEFHEDGLKLHTSFMDWYYRIHVLPPVLTLGNVAGDVERTVVVWNAFFSPVTLEDFSKVGEGITVDSSVAPPQDIAALQDVTYVFGISAAGPAVIAGSATWTIDGREYVVPITGRRSVLFSFPPDWKLGRVTETLHWKNTITSSFDGSREQVMRIRQRPRRSLSYRIRLRGDDARLLDQSVFGWTGRMFGVPLWHEKVKTREDAGQGAEELAFDTAHSSFVPGGAAVLFRSATEFELLDIATVSPEGITTRNSLSRLWPRGSVVVPVAPALPQETFSLSRALPSHMDTSADFMLSPAEAPLRLPQLPPPASYRGLELYTGETNWRTPLQVEMAARRIVVDGGLGTITAKPRVDFAGTVRSMSWLLKTRAAADELRAFFARREGVRVPVWMPSGADDFILAEQAEIGSTTLQVKRSEYGSLIGTHAARCHLVLVMRNGDRLPMRILGADVEGETTTISVDTGMPYVIRPQAVKRISFLGLYRLSSDTVSFDWHVPTVAEVAVNFTLKVPPE